MHEYLKEAREGAAKKLKGIQSGEPHTKVDSSSWSPPEMLEADKQTGMRPVSPRQYKSGGKVHGLHSKKRADRKARKEGGRAMSVDGFINRDDKMANDERAGVKKVGGMKRGGKIKREHHADGDVVGNMIRQDQIEQGMKGRGLPMRVPMPMPRPADKPVKYTGPKPTTNPNTGYKKGGAVHPDIAEDKALIRKMVKPSARTGKADGGKFDSPTHSFKMKLSNGEDTTTHNISMPGNSAADALVNAVKFANKGGWNVDNVAHTGSSAGAGSSAGLMNRGGRTKRDEHCWGGEAKSKKADGGATEAQRVGAASSKFYKEGSKPAVQSTKSPDFKTMRQADRDLTTALDQQGYKKGGRTKHAHGGEAGRGLYVRQGYPHEVPGADGGRTAKKRGGALGKGKTNVNIMIHPHSGAGAPPAMLPMGGPMVPPPPPRPQMTPMGGMPMGAPMGGAPELPPMGAGRPGMPPIGRKNGGKIPAGMKTQHIIDNAAGGGLGRLEKIKAYGLD
jgi:hypothetical protein